MTGIGPNPERPGDDLREYLDLVDRTVDAISDQDLEADLAAVLAETGRTEAPARPRRRLYTLAAAVVVFALLMTGALFAGAHWLAPDPPAPGPGAIGLDPLPGTDDGPGIGGPDLGGARYGGTDARTGVRLDFALQSKDWGTLITFAVSNIKGPEHYRLVATHTDGTTEPLAAWAVDDQGYGTAGHPEPLLLEAATDTPRDSIAHLEVVSVAENGAETIVVRVP